MFKSITNLIFGIVLIFGLIGCGSSSGDNNSTNNKDTIGDGNNSQDSTINRLKKTGQTTSYEQFDDGHYQTGVNHSYNKNDDIVTDNITGLEWQDNSHVKGDENKKSWEDAISYCSTLSLGEQNDWRLPIIEELESIVVYGKYEPTLDSTFSNSYNNYFWSASTNADSTVEAWGVSFNHGQSKWNSKKNNCSVRCVRGKFNLVSNIDFSRNDIKKTVSNSRTKLMWQDDYSDRMTVRKRMIWQDALIYCEELSLATYDDWRLPNIAELKNIVDKSKNDKTIPIHSVFVITSSDYHWSSTTTKSDTSFAWGVNFYYGNDISGNKEHKLSVRCVRDE